MDATYKLKRALHEKIYEAIEKEVLGDSTAVDHPRVVSSGGQPGSGKSSLLERSKADFADSNVVVINGDELRSFHPRVNEILRLDEKRFAELTDPDVRAWTKKLFDRAIQLKRNIIFENTMREAAPILQTMTELRKQGFHITVKIVATNERFSKTGIFRRYEEQKAAKGYGRFSEMSSHDAAYAGMPVTVQTIEEKFHADTILIFSRDGRLLYNNDLRAGTWHSPAKASETIKQEQQRNAPEE